MTEKFGQVTSVHLFVRALAQASVGAGNTVHDVQGKTVAEAATELIDRVGAIYAK